jgi:hypothetical protein
MLSDCRGGYLSFGECLARIEAFQCYSGSKILLHWYDVKKFPRTYSLNLGLNMNFVIHHRKHDDMYRVP